MNGLTSLIMLTATQWLHLKLLQIKPKSERGESYRQKLTINLILDWDNGNIVGAKSSTAAVTKWPINRSIFASWPLHIHLKQLTHCVIDQHHSDASAQTECNRKLRELLTREQELNVFWSSIYSAHVCLHYVWWMLFQTCSTLRFNSTSSFNIWLIFYLFTQVEFFFTFFFYHDHISRIQHVWTWISMLHLLGDF